jgi:thiol-disulfide isomerase/thioredoxin
MQFRPKYAVAGVLVALALGGFLWKYSGTLGGVDTSTKQGQDLVRGWHAVNDVALPKTSANLPGIRGAATGLPTTGSYLVNLWASNCGPCRHEMPWLERLSRTTDVKVVGVTRDNLLSRAVGFLDKHGVTYPNVRDQYGDFMASIGHVVPADLLPSSFILVNGHITWVRVGPFDSYADLRDSVTRRLS